MERIVTEDLPDGVPLVAQFDDERNRLDYYYPRLDSVAPTPWTRFFDLQTEKGVPNFDEGAISEYIVEQGWTNAFVRGMYASAKIDLVEGSHIYSQDRNDIRRTVSELVRQHIVLDRALGDKLAVREMFDLEYCANPGCQRHHPTEVRYFVRNGEIKYRFPSEDRFAEKNRECDELFSYVDDSLDSLEYPDDYAQRVAREFDELAWSVDFIRDAKTGEWYATDMGLDGLYYNTDTGGWVAISEHESPEKSPERFEDEMEIHHWKGTFDATDWMRWVSDNPDVLEKFDTI